jgi:regulator of sigma E protease
MIILSYLISFIGISFLVLIHELGHFLFCKLFDIPAPKFSIGMGPKIITKKYKGTEYSLSLLPIGGYVQIGDEDDQESEVSILYKKNWIKSTLVLFGGITANLIFAYIIIAASLFINKDITSSSNLKLFVPLESIIIKDKEDNQITLNYTSSIELLQQIKKYSFTLEDIDGETIIFENEKFFNENFTIEYNKLQLSDNYFDIIFFAFAITNNIIKQSALGIMNLFKGLNLKNLSGPLGIMKGASHAAEKGVIDFLLFLAFISISLAVLNLVPIPMLDGGQFVLLSIYKIIGRGIPEFFQTILTYGSIGLMIIMTLLSTYNDILKVFFN